MSITSSISKPTSSTGINHDYYYACDAAQLLETCLEHLQTVMELELEKTGRQMNSLCFQELQEALKITEGLLQEFFTQLLPPPSSPNSTVDDINDDGPPYSTLSESVAALRNGMERRMDQKNVFSSHSSSSSSSSSSATNNTSKKSQTFQHRRSATDTLLFRLIVALQLCLVRIDDAHFVVTGVRRCSSFTELRSRRFRRRWMVRMVFCGTVLGVTAYLLPRKSTREDDNTRGSYWYCCDPTTILLMVKEEYNSINQKEFLHSLAKAGTGTFLWFQLAKQCKGAVMTSKLDKTTTEIQEWHRQWSLVEGGGGGKARRLIEYAQQRHTIPRQGPSSSLSPPSSSSSFWDYYSEGELRFLIVRKALEAYYSWTDYSDVENGTNDSKDQPPKDLCSDARAMIQNSWGLVSRPGIKTFSLRASRLLKGASVADRIEIAGVPCFVISKYPCPELAAAIQQFHSKNAGAMGPSRRRLSAVQLSTIQEESNHGSTSPIPQQNEKPIIPTKLFAGAQCRQQDIILHCTGGGFFAHMIAFDLVYLLDWSASTGAVVVCPEFSLLPAHPFPTALQEVTRVYTTLVSGQATSALGFEVRNIAITGESTGANLASALCVNLCLGNSATKKNAKKAPPAASQQQPPSEEATCSNNVDDSLVSESMAQDREESCSNDDDKNDNGNIRLPDALMLSCAVLNMSLELSHSRVIGTEDPVLPSGVLSAISDAYLPHNLGVRKTHILASPLFAPNSILSRFPPTLLFASSNDPLLDDSVEFNQRLRTLGVESQIRAVQNMPHAYWGLYMAGFPEAKQVHKEAQEWLATKLTQVASMPKY